MIFGNLRSPGFGTYDAGIMAVTSLVVCREDETVDVLRQVLQDLDIQLEVAANGKAALAVAAGRRFDALVVDCQDEASGLSLLALFRAMRENRNAIVVALATSHAPVREIFCQGANFLIYKPLSRERALASLRSARRLILEERRIEPRIPVRAAASLAFPGKENAAATLVELSQSGLGLETREHLPPACKAYLQFSLPKSEAVVHLSGEVMWQDVSGRVGIRLVRVPQTSKQILQRWIEQHAIRPARSSPGNSPKPEIQNLELSARLDARSTCASDRRNFERQAGRLGAEVYREDSNVPHHATLSDISTGSRYVETPETFPPGTILTIVVQTRERKLCVAGKVERMHPGYGMGVRFVLANDGERAQVQQLIACAESEEPVRESFRYPGDRP
jgi:CheY-like chemotaxis protein